MSLKQNERPVASILTKLKDDDRAMVIHRKKLAATKPMVDTGKPSTQKYKHLKQNLKGKQLEADRNLDVERENRSLVGRLMYIMNNSVFEEELFGLDRHISYRPVSMNYKNRMDTMRQIEAENLAMMKRLISRNGKSDLNKHTLKPDPFHPPHLFETKNRMLLPRLHLERTMTRDGLLSPNKTGSAAGSPRSPPKSAPSTNQGGEEGFFESKTARYAPSQALGNEGGAAPTDRTAPAALGDDGSSSHGPVTDRLKPQAPAGAPKRGRPGGRAGRVAGGAKPQPPARAGRGGGGAGRPQATPGAGAGAPAAPGRASPPGAKLVLCKEGVKVSNVYVTLTVSAQRGGEPVLEVYEPLASLHLGFPVPRGALARLASAEQVKAMCTPRHPQAPALWKGLVAPQLELVQGAAAAPALRLVAADAARTVLAASAGAGAAGGAAGPPPDTPNTANIKSISHQYVQQQVGEAMRRASLESTAEARAGPPAGAEPAEPAAEVGPAQQEQEIDDAASHISQTAQSLEGEGQEDNEEEEEEDYGDDYEESEGNDEAAAAAKIQAVARGSAGRKEAAAKKEEHAQEDAAAAKIQAVARGSAGRKEAAAKKEEHAQEDAAAAKIQAVARGSAGRKEAAAKKEEAVAQEASGEASGDYADESLDAEGRKEAAAKKEVAVAQDASGEASGDYGEESFDAEG